MPVGGSLVPVGGDRFQDFEAEKAQGTGTMALQEVSIVWDILTNSWVHLILASYLRQSEVT